MLRLLGLKKEQTYGNLKTGVTEPDFHHRMSSGEFKLNDEPVKANDGSRMTQIARPGAVKPSGSTRARTDLKRIGHYLHAFFDQYTFTEGTGGALNIHEFWGSEEQYLHSYTAWATFDEFQKVIKGLLMEGLKLEVSNEFLNQTSDWIYKTETTEYITQSTYEIFNVEGDIPLMFYDVDVALEKGGTSVNLGIKNSFSFEGKNNHNQDGTIGMGSRFPQVQAAAQSRDITATIKSNLHRDAVSTIIAVEYGDDGIMSPSTCKVYKLGMTVTIRSCENTSEVLVMKFPKCTANVEYSASESDEIETTFKLVSLGTGEVTLNDGTTSVVTDCYCKLMNNVPKVSDEENWTH